MLMFPRTPFIEKITMKSRIRIKTGLNHLQGRSSYFPKYENTFLGHCYSCGNSRNKAIHCKINTRSNYARSRNDYGFSRNDHRLRNVHGSTNINYNPFKSLMN